MWSHASPHCVSATVGEGAFGCFVTVTFLPSRDDTAGLAMQRQSATAETWLCNMADLLEGSPLPLKAHSAMVLRFSRLYSEKT